MLVFLRAGAGSGMVIGMLATFRNIGLVMATLGAILPDTGLVLFRAGAVSDLSLSAGAASRLPSGSPRVDGSGCTAPRCSVARFRLPC